MINNYEPLISVIVPVYNVEEYVEKCIISLINQSYKNIEIVIVDDGSSDNSGYICKRLSDGIRVHYYNKTNGGLSDARNFGLKKITGEYVTFVDSDDYVAENYIEALYNAIRDNNCDISVCDEKRVYIRDGVELVKESPYRKINKDLVMPAKKGLECMIRQDLFDVSACMKMYKRELFNDVIYPSERVYEDIGTTYKLFLKAKKIVYLHTPMYYYLQRESSILHKKNSDDKKIKDGLLMVIRQKRDVCSVYPELELAADNMCFSMYCHILIENSSIDSKMQRIIEKKIKCLNKRIFLDNNCRTKARIAALLCCFFDPQILRAIK